VSPASKPRKRYEGGGIGELRGPRSRVALPSADEATLLPDPRAAHAALLDAFRTANGPKGTHNTFPNMSARDARAFANVITFALRNDLDSMDVYDAAVLWDKWRQAVDDVRKHLRPVRDDTHTNEASSDVWNACIELQHRGWDLIESMATSLRSPGEVFSRYCPWRADWATHDRLYPGAA
jgi:hypothetical protein